MVLHANRFVSMCSNPKLWGGIQNGGLKERLGSTIYYTNLMRQKKSLLESGNQVGNKQLYSLLNAFNAKP